MQRDVELGDLRVLFQQQMDPANRMAVAHARDADVFNVHLAETIADPSIVAKVILVGQVVGDISCFKLDGQDAVGYWLAREVWGRGIATRALELFLEHVNVRPLHARAARLPGDAGDRSIP